ncbi:hypothetical protein [uncultured Tenacibaculum sp.]|uniref:hypothetical protein n=1 Tax=uncultured Tenacibaculum sp. TaxID=174713 RepID=UPI00260E79EA|nr:hypothetical protein [uncultured Tenacibaculum sp.]
MKKLSLKNFKLEKEVISDLNMNQIRGGASFEEEDKSKAMSCVNYTKVAGGCPAPVPNATYNKPTPCFLPG